MKQTSVHSIVRPSLFSSVFTPASVNRWVTTVFFGHFTDFKTTFAKDERERGYSIPNEHAHFRGEKKYLPEMLEGFA